MPKMLRDRCATCDTVAIVPGQGYRRLTYVHDDRIYDWVQCVECAALASVVYEWCWEPEEGVDRDDYREWARKSRDDPEHGEAARAFLTRTEGEAEEAREDWGMPVIPIFPPQSGQLERLAEFDRWLRYERAIQAPRDGPRISSTKEGRRMIHTFNAEELAAHDAEVLATADRVTVTPDRDAIIALLDPSDDDRKLGTPWAGRVLHRTQAEAIADALLASGVLSNANGEADR